MRNIGQSQSQQTFAELKILLFQNIIWLGGYEGPKFNSKQASSFNFNQMYITLF